MTGTHRVALVTGASRGIGAATAIRLARDGFHVVANYGRDAVEAEGVVTEIRAAGGDATTMRADVGDGPAVRAMFDRVEAELGGIDVLVNNAGIQKLGTLAEMSDEDFDDLVRVNLKGSFHTMREAARRIRSGGRIINLSSGTTIVLGPRYGAYAATKAAIQAMTAVLAKEMRGRAVTVNAVSPGPVATELYLKGKTADQLAAAARTSPLERLGEPGDIANAIAFLAGPDGGWVNGQTVVVNGAFA